MLAAYWQAVHAFRWFHAESLPHNPDHPLLEGETLYYQVEEPTFAGLSELRGYLKDLFSDDLVDVLLPASGGRYVEVDGALYVQPICRPDDPAKGAESCALLWEDLNRCVIQVTVELLDPEQDFAPVGSEVHRFPYEKVGEKWIFTNFSLIR